MVETLFENKKDDLFLVLSHMWYFFFLPRDTHTIQPTFDMAQYPRAEYHLDDTEATIRRLQFACNLVMHTVNHLLIVNYVTDDRKSLLIRGATIHCSTESSPRCDAPGQLT